jgi:hypothetical protein
MEEIWSNRRKERRKSREHGWKFWRSHVERQKGKRWYQLSRLHALPGLAIVTQLTNQSNPASRKTLHFRFLQNLREHQRCTQKIFMDIKPSKHIRVTPSLISKENQKFETKDVCYQIV